MAGVEQKLRRAFEFEGHPGSELDALSGVEDFGLGLRVLRAREKDLRVCNFAGLLTARGNNPSIGAAVIGFDFWQLRVSVAAMLA